MRERASSSTGGLQEAEPNKQKTLVQSKTRGESEQLNVEILNLHQFYIRS